MRFLITMRHYYCKEDGKIVVQNAVAGHLGQKHEHTPEEFEQWVKDNDIKPQQLINLDECGSSSERS